MKKAYEYQGVLIPVKNKRKALIGSVMDLDYVIRNYLIRGYYDIGHRFHRIKKENNPEKIVENAVSVVLTIPRAILLSEPLYLAYRGEIYLVRRNGKSKR